MGYVHVQQPEPYFGLCLHVQIWSHTCPQSWAPTQTHGIWNSSIGPWWKWCWRCWRWRSEMTWGQQSSPPSSDPSILGKKKKSQWRIAKGRIGAVTEGKKHLTSGQQLHDQSGVGGVCAAHWVATNLFAQFRVCTCHVIYTILLKQTTTKPQVSPECDWLFFSQATI